MTARAEEILAGVAAGTYRFAPEVDPVHGAAFPPGWRPLTAPPRAPQGPHRTTLARRRQAEERA